MGYKAPGLIVTEKELQMEGSPVGLGRLGRTAWRPKLAL